MRAEFFSVFNRTYLSNPTSTNAQAPQVRNGSGVPASGFGYINSGTIANQPRNGQIVGRFEW